MKFYFDTVGCRLNQAEIEEMAAKLRLGGHQIVGNLVEADTVIINSCAVTAAASSDSRQKVHQAHQQGIKNIIFTGCWATLYPQQAGALEGVTSVVSNSDKMNIPVHLLDVEDYMIALEPISRQPLPGAHHRTRAFIKAQDGCDNFCTYCITRVARGKASSIAEETIRTHVNEAVSGGAKEIVLTGVNLGSWGKDLGIKHGLEYLLYQLLEKTAIERIRLSSLEPWDIPDSFFALWQNPRMCPHLHLPLQSGSAPVLKRMARNTTPEKFRRLVETARQKIPGLAITTDVIVGFPGETPEEFADTLDFVRVTGLDGGHVFRYSKREGTAAAKLPMQVPGAVSKERAQHMRELLDAQEQAFLRWQTGKPHQVLWEACRMQKPGKWVLEGYSENYCRVRVIAQENRWNQVDTVQAEKLEGKNLQGRIISFGSKRDER